MSRTKGAIAGTSAFVCLFVLGAGCNPVPQSASSPEGSPAPVLEEELVVEEVEEDDNEPRESIAKPVLRTPLVVLPFIASPLVFEASRPTLLPVWTVGLETVRVRCYAIRLEDHPVAALLSPVDDELVEVCDKTLSTGAMDHEPTGTMVDLSDVFDGGHPHVLLVVEGTDVIFEDHPELVPLSQWSIAPIYRTALRSGLAIDYARDSRTDEVTVRVTGLSDGGPVEGARVFELGSKREVLTDGAGLAKPGAISEGDKKKLNATWPLRRRRFREEQPPSVMENDEVARDWRWFVAATEDDAVLVGGPVLRLADNRLRSWVPRMPPAKHAGDVGDVGQDEPASLLPTESEPLRGEVSTLWFDAGAPKPGGKVRMHLETSPDHGHGLVFIHTRQGTRTHPLVLEAGRGELELAITGAYGPLTDVHVLIGGEHLSLEWYFPPISEAHLNHLPSRSTRPLPWPVELQIHRSRDHLVTGELAPL